MRKLILTHEERLARERELRKKRMSRWTPEHLAQYKLKARTRWDQWKKDLPEEKQVQIHENIKSQQRKRYSNLSPEQKEKEKQRKLKAYLNETEEQKIQRRKIGVERAFNFKIKVLQYYSHNTMRCMNPDCEVPGGAKNIDGLQIDHINGGGNLHRVQLRKQGTHIYKWLVEQNFPPGYQVYCGSCNQIKRKKNREDYVPHKPRKKVLK